MAALAESMGCAANPAQQTDNIDETEESKEPELPTFQASVKQNAGLEWRAFIRLETAKNLNVFTALSSDYFQYVLSRNTMK